jgi:hypothetical protein
MPTHLLLEGPDIESVLAQLQDAHGPDAKIVQAERVRVGGFAGFFAKQRYEVTVEIDEEQVANPAFEAELRAFTGSGAVPAPAPGVEPARSDSTPIERSGIDALLSAAENLDQAEIGGALVAEIDRTATVSAPSPALSASPLRELAIQGWHRPVSTEGDAFSDMITSITQNLAEPDPALLSAVPAVPAVEPFEPFEPYEPIRQFGRPSLPAPRAQPSPIPTASPAASPAARPNRPTRVDLGPTREQLAGIGVPARLLGHVRHADPLLALRDVVDALETPRLPTWRSSATRGGALVVVVGAWDVAQAAVRGLVAELGVEAAAVLAVATATDGDIPPSQTVRSHAAAVSLVRQARQAHDVALLVVDPGQSMQTATRVADLVAALEPQSLVVATDAADGLGVGLTALDALEQSGLLVDSIAVDGVAGAAEPAAVFAASLPVSWIDGRLATAGSWLGILVDRLAGRC